MDKHDPKAGQPDPDRNIRPLEESIETAYAVEGSAEITLEVESP